MESNGEKDALRQQLETERRRIVDGRLNEHESKLGDHEDRIRDIERTAITKDDCGKLIVERANTAREQEARLRKLEEFTAQSVGMGVIGKLIVPFITGAGAAILVKLIFK